jgi:Tfp pilus assembly protein PilO
MALSLNNQISRIKPLYDYLKKQRENYRFMRSLEISATFILITFFLFFAIRPTVIIISTLWGDIQSKQLLRSQLKTKINNVILAQDLFSQVQEKYQIVNTSLPDRPSFYETAQQLQQTGNNSALNINSFDYNLQTGEKDLLSPNLKTYQISIDVNGSFASATKLITELLANRRLINISSISIGPSGLANPDVPVTVPAGSISTSFVSGYYYWSPTK